MYNWTDEQLKAIKTSGVPIIVSAAAGSGKTAVLVERTIRLLSDPEKGIPADTLLAVTFTNDAASQMSQKLSWELDRRAEEEPDNSWIQRQQALLSLAEITTINSFCYNFVKDNLSKTDFRTGLRILDENEAAMLIDRALTAVLEREYSERPERTEKLISLFCRENDASLRKMIFSLYRFLRSLPFRKNWISGVIKDLESGKASQRLADEISSSLRETLDSAASLSSRLRSCTEVLEYHSAAKKILIENCNIADSMIEKISNAGLDGINNFLDGVSWLPLTSARQTKAEKGSASEIEAALYESAKDAYNRLKEIFKRLDGLCGFSRSKADQEAAETAEIFTVLCELCEKLDAEATGMKIERNALDFADTELLCVKLLLNCDEQGRLSRTELCEEIVRSKRYRVILIDEFQDVNNLQEVIFKAISDTEDLSEIGKNVFVVGDVKQSIYRFRQANPMVFMKTREQGKSPDSSVRELLLLKNFRSRGCVLDFCNFVFRSLMSRRIGETDYTDEEALVQGSDYGGEDCPTEIITIDADGAENAMQTEFTAVARRIRQLIDGGAPVKDGEGLRPCRPSDFCVLTRNNVTGSALSEIFEKEGLKVMATDTSGYLKSREISLLLNLLTVISNPMQDIPLASVMLSPIMGFCDDDLARLKIFSREDRLYKTALAVTMGEYNADGALVKKCIQAVELLKKLSVLASGLTVTRLIRKIYDMTDIFAVASSYEDGDRKCANLYLLLEYARSYEQASSDGVTGFLRYIDYISKSGGDFEQALTVTESSDAVTVKTVHRSKGLEYPFVFICQTGKRFNKTDLNGPMLLNSEKGVGFSFLDYSTLTKRRTLFWKRVREKNTSELLSEELRLLYVAMTRAKERLFIVLDVSEKALSNAKSGLCEIFGGRLTPMAVEKADCTADWLIMALSGQPEFDPFFKGSEPRCDCSEAAPKIKVLPMPPASGYIAAEEQKPSALNKELTEAIIRSFGHLQDRRLTEYEAKLSVSEIVKDDALSFFPKVTSLDESLDELDAAQRGTITHRFMQFCDFESASKNISAEISRLTKENRFTQRESEAIDALTVRKFFESDIYRRLSLSKNILRERRFIVRFDDINVSESLKEIYRGTEGMLQGVADCLFEEEDGYVLVDYKTDRVTTVLQLAEKYSGQLELYKAAFDVLLDKPVKSCFIYSFRLGEGIEIFADNF